MHNSEIDAIDFDSYQEWTNSTSITSDDLAYAALGLNGEAGEVAEIIKKHLRGDFDREVASGRLISELGDVLWYLAQTAERAGLSLKKIAQFNIVKLEQRKKYGTTRGDGEGPRRLNRADAI